MTDTKTSETMSPELRKIAERARARRDPNARILSLARLVNIDALGRAYARQRKDAAVRVDGITKEQFGQELEARLRDLHERLVARRYRHRPIRRVHIPKEGGKARPIGISVFGTSPRSCARRLLTGPNTPA